MAEGLSTAAGRRLGTQPAGAPDTSAFDAAVAGVNAAAADELTPPPREKPMPTDDEAREIRGTAKRQQRKRELRPRAGAAAQKAELAARDYARDLDQLGEAVWIGLSQLPWTAGYAPLLNAKNRAPLVNAWNQAAQQSPAVRARIEALTSGGGNSWILGVAIATVPVVITAYQLAGSAELRAQAAEANKAELTTWARSKGLIQDAEPDVPEDVPEAA